MSTMTNSLHSQDGQQADGFSDSVAPIAEAGDDFITALADSISLEIMGLKLEMIMSALLLASAATAQYIVDALSFGHQGALNAAGSEIPGWTVSGSDYNPQILSDRVILTPPAPGNKRGGIYAKHDMVHQDWRAELEFRASGQERGGGNLNLWYTKQLPDHLPSVYTVENFDGLVLVVDQYGGSGGSIRGFLNDGSLNFRTHHNIDEMAFGNCNFAYRNRGEMSKLTLEQKPDGFEVLIDGNSCFRSSVISLPPQYFFGISAASAENPDSFEISKFVVTTLPSIAREEPRVGDSSAFQNQQAPTQQQQSHHGGNSPPSNAGPTDLSEITNRLEQLQNLVSNIAMNVNQLEERQNNRQAELLSRVGSGGGGAAPAGPALDALERRAQSIEATVQRIQRDIEGRDYQNTLNDLQSALKDTQSNLMAGMSQSMSQIVSGNAPKMGMFIAIVLAFQIMLVGAYFVYKKRRASAPKKFL